MSSRYNNNSYQPSQVDAKGFAVPYSISYRSKPQPIGGAITSTYVSSSSSTVIGSGDTLRFEISNRDFLAASNAYLMFTLETKANTASASAFAVNVFPFSSYLIRRAQIEIGSTVIDSINDYGHLYSSLCLMNCSPNYVSNDGSFEGKNRLIPEAAANGVFGGGQNPQQMIMPLLGVFQSEKALPLISTNSSVVVTLEFVAPNTLKDLVGNSAANAGFDYRLVNPKLFIQRVDPGEIYKREFAMALNSAQALRVPYVTFTGQSFGAASQQGTFTQIIQENCNSLLGLMIVVKEDTDAGRVGPRYVNANFSELEVRVDSVLMPSYIIQGNVQSFAETQRLFSNLWDTQSIASVDYQKYSSSSATTGAYNSAAEGNFVTGVSFKRYSDDNTISNLGVPVRNGVEVRMKGLDLGASKPMSVYVYLIKEQNMVISATGEVGVQK